MCIGMCIIYRSPGFVSVIKVRRLEWINFVVTFNGGRILKKLPEGKPAGGSKIERSRLRWLDDVEPDLMIMGVRIWTKLTVDGTE
jgi:hypothetical protein